MGYLGAGSQQGTVGITLTTIQTSSPSAASTSAVCTGILEPSIANSSSTVNATTSQSFATMSDRPATTTPANLSNSSDRPIDLAGDGSSSLFFGSTDVNIPPTGDPGGGTGALVNGKSRRLNYNLRGHRNPVRIVEWNMWHKKLASCDESGICYVWICHEDRWSVELVNDRGVQIRDFSWSPSGDLALISYFDSFVLVGSAQGQRIWSTNLSQDTTVLSSAWLPDEHGVVLGTKLGELVLLSGDGNMVGRYMIWQNHAINHLAWSGVRANSDNQSTLAACFDNGAVYFLRGCDDVDPVMRHTNLDIVRVQWSANSEYFAVVGTTRDVSLDEVDEDQQTGTTSNMADKETTTGRRTPLPKTTDAKAGSTGPAADADCPHHPQATNTHSPVNRLMIYSGTGHLVYDREIPSSPGKAVTAFSWGYADTRIFVAVENEIIVGAVYAEVPSLCLLTAHRVWQCLENSALVKRLPVSILEKRMIELQSHHTLQCHVPDSDHLVDYVCRPSSHRWYCTIMPEPHLATHLTATYTLCVEYLGGHVPVLRGRQINKFRPEFEIRLYRVDEDYADKDDSISGTRDQRYLSESHDDDGATQLLCVPSPHQLISKTDVSEEEEDDESQVDDLEALPSTSSPAHPSSPTRKSPFTRSFTPKGATPGTAAASGRTRTDSSTRASGANTSGGADNGGFGRDSVWRRSKRQLQQLVHRAHAQFTIKQKERKLVQVTSNLWCTRFKILALEDTLLPPYLGQVIYKTSVLHLQPRQMSVHLVDLSHYKRGGGGGSAGGSSTGILHSHDANNNPISTTGTRDTSRQRSVDPEPGDVTELSDTEEDVMFSSLTSGTDENILFRMMEDGPPVAPLPAELFRGPPIYADNGGHAGRVGGDDVNNNNNNGGLHAPCCDLVALQAEQQLMSQVINEFDDLKLAVERHIARMRQFAANLQQSSGSQQQSNTAQFQIQTKCSHVIGREELLAQPDVGAVDTLATAQIGQTSVQLTTTHPMSSELQSSTAVARCDPGNSSQNPPCPAETSTTVITDFSSVLAQNMARSTKPYTAVQTRTIERCLVDKSSPPEGAAGNPEVKQLLAQPRTTLARRGASSGGDGTSDLDDFDPTHELDSDFTLDSMTDVPVELLLPNDATTAQHELYRSPNKGKMVKLPSFGATKQAATGAYRRVPPVPEVTSASARMSATSSPDHRLHLGVDHQRPPIRSPSDSKIGSVSAAVKTAPVGAGSSEIRLYPLSTTASMLTAPAAITTTSNVSSPTKSVTRSIRSFLRHSHDEIMGRRASQHTTPGAAKETTTIATANARGKADAAATKRASKSVESSPGLILGDSHKPPTGSGSHEVPRRFHHSFYPRSTKSFHSGSDLPPPSVSDQQQLAVVGGGLSIDQSPPLHQSSSATTKRKDKKHKTSTNHQHRIVGSVVTACIRGSETRSIHSAASSERPSTDSADEDEGVSPRAQHSALVSDRDIAAAKPGRLPVESRTKSMSRGLNWSLRRSSKRKQQSHPEQQTNNDSTQRTSPTSPTPNTPVRTPSYRKATSPIVRRQFEGRKRHDPDDDEDSSFKPRLAPKASDEIGCGEGAKLRSAEGSTMQCGQSSSRMPVASPVSALLTAPTGLVVTQSWSDAIDAFSFIDDDSGSDKSSSAAAAAATRNLHRNALHHAGGLSDPEYERRIRKPRLQEQPVQSTIPQQASAAEQQSPSAADERLSRPRASTHLQSGEEVNDPSTVERRGSSGTAYPVNTGAEMASLTCIGKPPVPKRGSSEPGCEKDRVTVEDPSVAAVDSRQCSGSVRETRSLSVTINATTTTASPIRTTQSKQLKDITAVLDKLYKLAGELAPWGPTRTAASESLFPMGTLGDPDKQVPVIYPLHGAPVITGQSLSQPQEQSDNQLAPSQRFPSDQLVDPTPLPVAQPNLPSATAIAAYRNIPSDELCRRLAELSYRIDQLESRIAIGNELLDDIRRDLHQRFQNIKRTLTSRARMEADELAARTTEQHPGDPGTLPTSSFGLTPDSDGDQRRRHLLGSSARAAIGGPPFVGRSGRHARKTRSDRLSRRPPPTPHVHPQALGAATCWTDPGTASDGAVGPHGKRRHLPLTADPNQVAPEILSLHNKAPMWNDASQVYQLDFGGRVTQESAKNFQIEHQSRQVMQFGRIEGNAYTLDFQAPFTAVQAFAVALANITQRLK